MSEENSHKREMSQEKLDAMRRGRLFGALKKAIHGLIQEYSDKDIEDVLELVNANIEKIFETYERDQEEIKLLAELREKFGDKFVIKSKRSTLQ